MEREQHSDVWRLDASEFPMMAPLEQRLRFLVGYATLAPSGHNTQPWQFGVGADDIFVLADRSRALPVVDPHDRELAISCGAAIGTLEVAARRFSLEVTVEILPDEGNPDQIARLLFSDGAPPDPQEVSAFKAIQQRRTNRTAYYMEPLPVALQDACSDIAAGASGSLDWIENSALLEHVADLVAQGDQVQFDDPRFRRELAKWVRSSALGSRDGLSGKGFGMPDILSPVGKFAIRTFDLGDSVAAADQQKILSGTPALVLLSSAQDDPESWIETGRVLAKVLLAVTAAGYCASFLNQPIEVDELRPNLARAVGIKGHPQILLRVGRSADELDPTVRRPLSDVIVM